MKIPRTTLRLKIRLSLLSVSILPLTIISALFYFQIQQNAETMAHDVNEVYVALEHMKTLVLIGALSAILSSLLLTTLLSNNIARPIKALVAVTNRLERGDMKVRASVETNDEIGDLAASFNRMVKSVNRRTVSVKMLSEDIARRKKTETALRESEQKFRGLVENINDVVFQLSIDGVFQYVSPAIEKLYGFKSKDIIGYYIGITTPPEEMPKVKEVINTILSGKIVQRWELNQIDKNGKIICMEISAAPMEKDGRIVSILGVMRDITERKKAQVELQMAYNELKETQSQLIQAEKLHVVGILASGVAHEVKNPLGIIMQGVEYLEGEISQGKKKLMPIYDMIKEAVKRADTIIRGMLDFARPAPLKLEPYELNKVVETSSSLVEKQLALQNIKLTMDSVTEIPQVLLDPNQMQQVFINIILNSVQAMPKGGEVRIRIYTKELTETEFSIGRRKIDSFKVGSTVVVCEIEDTGSGIPKDKLDKVFDPFFTTKPTGQGTGLGLTIIRTIVEKHKGIINIESQEGKGTKVVVSLPVVKESSEKV